LIETLRELGALCGKIRFGSGRVPGISAFFGVPGYKPVCRWHLPDASFKAAPVRGGRQLQNAEGNTGRFAYSPHGKQFLAGVGGVTLIDVETGKIVRQFALDP